MGERGEGGGAYSIQLEHNSVMGQHVKNNYVNIQIFLASTGHVHVHVW